MGAIKKTKKFALVKRMLNKNDPRLKKAKEEEEVRVKKNAEEKKKSFDDRKVNTVEQVPTSMFFKYNSALGPPYRILIDTNFIHFSVKNKLDIFKSMMDCLLAKCTPCITDCVMAELEKMGIKYRVGLRIAKDPRFERLVCQHKGTYADDCLVRRVEANKVYIVATCDKDLRRRIRKVPGVPIMYISSHRYTIERLPNVNNAPR